jgi:FeS assembly protein IscX
MKWTDTREIAIALAEHHPDVDPRAILFTDLRRWVLELPGFDDDPKHSGEWPNPAPRNARRAVQPTDARRRAARARCPGRFTGTD